MPRAERYTGRHGSRLECADDRDAAPMLAPTIAARI